MAGSFSHTPWGIFSEFPFLCPTITVFNVHCGVSDRGSYTRLDVNSRGEFRYLAIY